jgi:microcompartment protein CcmK/EutM
MVEDAILEREAGQPSELVHSEDSAGIVELVACDTGKIDSDTVEEEDNAVEDEAKVVGILDTVQTAVVA